MGYERFYNVHVVERVDVVMVEKFIEGGFYGGSYGADFAVE